MCILLKYNLLGDDETPLLFLGYRVHTSFIFAFDDD